MKQLQDLFKKHKAIVFFDTETTGLDATSCQVIELAALKVVPGTDGTPVEANRLDLFIRLPEGEKLPDKIVELTGITDEMLEADGVTEKEAAEAFFQMCFSETTNIVLAAHNIQFDLLFIREMIKRSLGVDIFRSCRTGGFDSLDTLTVYKDRRAYPHRLANAIEAYHLEDKVQNSHRAIDDVLALYEVCKAMDQERPDLENYLKLFGYNPKYGVSGEELPGIRYMPQRFHNFMTSPEMTLPALAGILN